MNKKSARWWITTMVLPGLMLVAIIGIPLVFADRMPKPVARHWDLAGEPNGSSPLWALMVFTGALAAFAWGALVAADRRETVSRSLVAVVYFLEGILLATMISTVQSNLDVTSWDQASQVGLLHVVGVVGVALVAGAAGWFLAEEEPVAGAKTADGPVLTVGLAGGASAVWFGKAESRFMPPLAGILLVGAIIVGGIGTFILVAVAGVMFFLSAARVYVSEQGVSIGFGWWGWPRKLILLTEISHADVLEIEPMAYGGWGLRGRGSGDDRSWAVIIRRGPGLRLVRPNKSDVIVTVDDAEQGAGLINDLLARTGRPFPH